MTTLNKAPFELEPHSLVEVPAYVVPPKSERLIEQERRHEGRIERLRPKATFAFLLMAVHASRKVDRMASGISSHQNAKKKKNKSEAGAQEL